MSLSLNQIEEYLGGKELLEHTCEKIGRDRIQSPSGDFVDKVFAHSDRSIPVLNNLQRLFSHGRLSDSGYLSILPVDQGIEHSAGASFAPNPDYFDPEHIIKLAIEGGCNGVASTLGVLGSMARRYAHKIPFILKVNHNELLSHPNTFNQIRFGSVKQAREMGAVAIGATIYFGSAESERQIQEIQKAFEHAHALGMFTILWCYIRSSAFKTDGTDYHASADLTGQANHLGVTIGADIIKQKLPTNNGGYKAVNKHGSFGKFTESMYTDLATENPIDLVRYQVANNYMGRIGLINSGGASGDNDMADAVTTAVLNKRGGGMGLITGRKAFQRPLKEGLDLLNAVQDVYLNDKITIA